MIAAPPDPSFLSAVPGWAVVGVIAAAVIGAVVTPWTTGRQQRTLRDRIAKDVAAWAVLPDRIPVPPMAAGDGPKEKLYAHIGRLTDQLVTSRKAQYLGDAKRMGMIGGACAVVVFLLWLFSGVLPLSTWVGVFVEPGTANAVMGGRDGVWWYMGLVVTLPLAVSSLSIAAVMAAMGMLTPTHR